jgi:effector-binding domain-containing protein
MTGKQSFRIKGIEASSGAKVTVMKKKNPSHVTTRITIRGAGTKVEAAFNELLSLMEKINVDLTIISVT